MSEHHASTLSPFELRDLLHQLDYDRTTPVPHEPLPLLRDAIRSLSDDGDTFEIADGYTLRLRITPDDVRFEDVEDESCFGKIEQGRAQESRPSDFDGRARIVYRSGSDVWWWQPPSPDVIGTVWDDETMRKEAQRVGERIEFGYSIIVLELIDADEDEIESASLGAVDEMYPELICELASEIEATIAERETKRIESLKARTCEAARKIAGVR